MEKNGEEPRDVQRLCSTRLNCDIACDWCDFEATPEGGDSEAQARRFNFSSATRAGLGLCPCPLQVRGHRLHMCDRDLTGLILNSEVYW